MNRRTLFILTAIILVVALLGCNWTLPLRLLTKPTSTPAIVPSATPLALPDTAVTTPPLTPAAPTGAGSVVAEEELLAGLYERVSPSVVYIEVSQGGLPSQGSGFIWDEQGHIITNNHVVEGAVAILVQFFDGLIIEAEIVGRDPQSDIAVLRIDSAGIELRPVTVGDSDAVRVGQMAVAIGNPFEQAWTMTRGIVSALERTIQSGVSLFYIPDVIQTDAAINPGNSGGPLLDSQGRVIGMNTQILSRTGSSSGIGFAVPVNIIKLVVPELIVNGRYTYAWLGIRGGDLPPSEVERLNLPVRQGTLIVEVTPDGPAERAGLRVDDVITAVDSEPMHGIADVIAYLVRYTRPGQSVELSVIRNGRQIVLSVVLGERPSQ